MHYRILICGVLVTLLGLVAPGVARAFPDVPPDRLDYVAVTGLATKGAIEGFVDGRFRPEAPVLRAQFVKMLASAVYLPPVLAPGRTPFRDLGDPPPGISYPWTYIVAAYEAGITKGKTPTVFEPYSELTRAEAMTMAVRVAQKLRARDFRPLPRDYEGWFAGYDDPVHGGNAKLAEANHLLAGIDLHGWTPQSPATRSEAARIVWNLVNCFG